MGGKILLVLLRAPNRRREQRIANFCSSKANLRPFVWQQPSRVEPGEAETMQTRSIQATSANPPNGEANSKRRTVSGSLKPNRQHSPPPPRPTRDGTHRTP